MNLVQTLYSLQAASLNPVRDNFDATADGFRCHACGKMMGTAKAAAKHLAKAHGKLSGAKLTTKKRKALPKGKFAWVDPKTGKGKLPIHDEEHVRAAMGRFNQTQGIPESEKPKVARKIARAAKRMGIDPSGFEKEHVKAASKGEYIIPPESPKVKAAKKKPLKIRTQSPNQGTSGRPSPMTMPVGGPMLAVGELYAFAVYKKPPERW